MIDTHCHLTDPRLLIQLDGVMERAAAAGVGRMVTIGTAPDEWAACLEVCGRFGNVRAAIGVHPNYCNEAQIAQVAELREVAKHPAVVAIGEMGLDYHYDSVPKARQYEFFEAQLQIAVEMGKPVVIHSRESIDDCLSVLRNFDVRAVFHCFTGSGEEAKRILDGGFLIGFTGVVTFKKSDELRRVAAEAPAERILVETDAPYLAPEPKRGQKINEPALTMYTAAAVAAARRISVGEIDRITTENAVKFYGWT